MLKIRTEQAAALADAQRGGRRGELLRRYVARGGVSPQTAAAVVDAVVLVGDRAGFDALAQYERLLPLAELPGFPDEIRGTWGAWVGVVLRQETYEVEARLRLLERDLLPRILGEGGGDGRVAKDER